MASRLHPHRAYPANMDGFDAGKLLTSAGPGRSTVGLAAKSVIFRQGDPADAAFYIVDGRVQLSVVSEQGKEGIVAILGPSDFFGSCCLAGQPSRTASASAMVTSTLIRIEKKAMIRALHEHSAFSEMFISFLLSHKLRMEADLVDQLFQSSEKRLARFLLELADFDKEGKRPAVIPRISQETMAARVGTTRARVNFFMNKFRKSGFIDYDGAVTVHASLASVLDPPDDRTPFSAE